MAEWAFVDAFAAYRHKPGISSKGKTVNQFGFISTPDISIIKPKDTIRIVFLGGSATAGTGHNLPDGETWPWKTAKILQEKTGKKIDFINGAAGGYTSFESYGLLWSRIRHFSPDIIVVYHGWNEMYYFNEVDQIARWRMLPDGSWSLERTAIDFKIYEPHWVDPLLRWSQVLTRIRLRFSKQLDSEIGRSNTLSLTHDYLQRGFDIWRTNLKLMKSASEIFGAKLFVAKQATLIVPNLSQKERKRCGYAKHAFNHDTHVMAFQGLYKVIDEEMPTDSIIDLTVISGQSELFYDHIHPTTEGTTQIANIVSNSLIQHIIKN
jgi:lysophospholipase L1-like esterase